ncbi:MAG: hydroxyacid dehydrogenase [Ruminococcaceae bacterium]|nr:hydroxyacid dehydrogenase [Oscillospiraceae bacterium]
MKISILDIATLGDDLNFDAIHSLGTVTVYDLTRQEDVIERIRDAEVLILNKVKLNRDNLPYAEKLKLICITATGFDNVDLDYCREHGIAVCNVAGYSTDSVVQLTVAMAFSLATNLNTFDGYVKSGRYTKSGVFNCVKPVFREISALNWGVVGLGNIGRKVADIAKTMGCRVLAYKRTPVADYPCVDIDTLCRESDIISIHTPLSNETYHLIDENRLAMMKNGAILINVARGAVVDETAVCKAVMDKKLGGLGVDVYSTEPMQPDSPYQKLLNFENVIFTPHMAWGAIDARQRCMDEVAKNIESYLTGGKRSRLV